jgi:hypothetical protein
VRRHDWRRLRPSRQFQSTAWNCFGATVRKRVELLAASMVEHYHPADEGQSVPETAGEQIAHTGPGMLLNVIDH